MAECLSENTIQELVAGALSSDARVEAHLHIETCAACRMLVIELARDGDRDQIPVPDLVHPDAVKAKDPQLSRSVALKALATTMGYDNPVVSWDAPSEIEEYRIIRLLGAGSMGVVFLAHDKLLDRAVAIKFVSALEISADKRERAVSPSALCACGTAPPTKGRACAQPRAGPDDTGAFTGSTR